MEMLTFNWSKTESEIGLFDKTRLLTVITRHLR